MIDLMARVCSVVAQKRLHGFKLKETHRSTSSEHLMNGIARTGLAQKEEQQASLEVIANDLLAEIGVWKKTSHFRRAHARVQVGSIALESVSSRKLTV